MDDEIEKLAREYHNSRSLDRRREIRVTAVRCGTEVYLRFQRLVNELDGGIPF